MGVLSLDFDNVANSIFLENKKTHDTYCFLINESQDGFKKFGSVKNNTEKGMPNWCKHPTYFNNHITIHKFLDHMKESLFNHDYPLAEGKFNDKVRGKVIKWIANSQVKRLAKPIAEFIRTKMQTQVPEKLIKLEKRIFSVVGPKHIDNILSCIQALHAMEDEIVYNDLMKYPAACIEAVHKTSKYYLPNNSYYKEFYNWMQSFASGGKLYGNLTKTLISAVGNQGQRLFHLMDAKLERPITNQLELRFYLYYMTRHNTYRYYGMEYQNQQEMREYRLKTFMFASAEQIKKAAKIVSRGLHRTLDFRKKLDIASMVYWLDDFPEVHRGGIIGLAEKSLEWHRTVHLRQISSLTKHQVETKTALPPIELPKNTKLRFLDSVKAIHEESMEMQHCILSYANSAVSGSCYLFHIEHNNEKASAQVDTNGKVVQCYGPQNTSNSATKYGASALARWGSKLRNKDKSQEETEHDEPIQLPPILQNEQVDANAIPF